MVLENYGQTGIQVEPTYVVELDEKEFSDVGLGRYQFTLDRKGRINIKDNIKLHVLQPVDSSVENFLKEQVENVLFGGEIDQNLFRLLSKYSPGATVLKCTINANIKQDCPPTFVVRIPPTMTVRQFEALNNLQNNMREINEIYGDNVRFNLYNHLRVYENNGKINLIQINKFIEDTLDKVSPKQFIKDVERSYFVIKELQETSRLISIADLTDMSNYINHYTESAKKEVQLCVSSKKFSGKITQNEAEILIKTIMHLSDKIIHPLGTNFDAEKYHSISELHHGDPIWVSNIFKDDAGVIHINDPALPMKKGLGDPHIDSIRCRQSALSLLAKSYEKSVSSNKAIDKTLEWYVDSFSEERFNTKPVLFDFSEIFKDIGIVNRDLTKQTNLLYWSIVNGLSGIKHAQTPLGVQVNREGIRKVAKLLGDKIDFDLSNILAEKVSKRWEITT
jgi:hypothetical protein